MSSQAALNELFSRVRPTPSEVVGPLKVIYYLSRLMKISRWAVPGAVICSWFIYPALTKEFMDEWGIPYQKAYVYKRPEKAV